MKKLKKINLRDLGQAEMQKKTMGMLKGGIRHYCGCTDDMCPCKYAGDKEGPNDSYYGGASTEANRDFNGGTFSVSLAYSV